MKRKSAAVSGSRRMHPIVFMAVLLLALKCFALVFETASLSNSRIGLQLSANPVQTAAKHEANLDALQEHLTFGDNAEDFEPWMHESNDRNDDKNLKLLLTPDHPNLLDELRQCPDVDIFVPSGVRGFGYCGDAVAYAKYTDRAFNHYWDGIPDAPDFPKDKPVYLMPNVGMYELNESHFWNYAQEGNPRNTQVFYTRHTSSDVANYARRKLGGDAIAKKGFENVRFIHTVGGSAQKGTNEVIECWLSRPDFPQLDLLASDEAYINMFEKPYGDRIPGSKINLTEHCLPAIPFGKVIAEASFFLCPSRMEGYGHYINQARAFGGVIATSNSSPMNELIDAPAMGVYVDTERAKDPNMFLGGGYRGEHGLRDSEGMHSVVTADGVCRAVEHILLHTNAAQRQYRLDTKFFARAMLKLRQFATAVRQNPPLAVNSPHLRAELKSPV
ncbi:hypothetical protein FI667_g15923, partial [Globisporangium splendens]